MGSTLSQFIRDFYPVPVMQEMIRIFPDALFWGVGVLAAVTLSYSFSVFFVSLFEGVGIYYILKNFNNYLGVIQPSTDYGTPDHTCAVGLKGVTAMSIMESRESSKLNFPSSHTFMLSFIASYILSVIVMFKDELDILGPTYGESYKSRIYFSTCSFAVMMFIAMTYRLFYRCDSFTVILVSFITGVTAGALVVQQNVLLLGIDGLNLLGIPILRKRTADGDDLLVCSSSNS